MDDQYSLYDQRNKNNKHFNVNVTKMLNNSNQSSNAIAPVFTAATTNLTNDAKNLIYRVSSKNPYLGKGIGGIDKSLPIKGKGFGGYVTSQGIFKAYPSQKIYNATAGKNGCPVNTINGLSKTTNVYAASLKQGTDMISGQSCGNEGQNVYASTLISSPTTTYMGCYNDKYNSQMLIIYPTQEQMLLV